MKSAIGYPASTLCNRASLPGLHLGPHPLTFGGLAAEKTGRCARLLELNPLYCDTILRRWKAFTGKRARHCESGRSFKEVEEQRADDVLAETSSCDQSSTAVAPGQGSAYKQKS